MGEIQVQKFAGRSCLRMRGGVEIPAHTGVSRVNFLVGVWAADLITKDNKNTKKCEKVR